ncbi:MAG: lamin tail domain-containing protein, partial [Clostridia bacterium]|nr:lamin tail domain-containing protein [Clostridia bacterium]
PEALAGGDAVPDYILSMTERIQGVTVKEGRIYLSQSFGRRAYSLIFRYGNMLEGEPGAYAELSGRSVPIWKLDSSTLEEVLLAPPMSECLCTVGDAIYVLFESAAQAYIGNAENPMDRAFRLTDF